MLVSPDPDASAGFGGAARRKLAQGLDLIACGAAGAHPSTEDPDMRSFLVSAPR